MIPFVLACVILACNQPTGVNSIIGYNATILIQAGLGDRQAHLGYVLFTIVNFLATIVAVVLVDRKGRKFLLSLGTAGVIVSMICVGLLFHKTEKLRVDVRDAVQAMVTTNQTLTLAFNEANRDQSAGRKISASSATNVGHHLFLRRFHAATPPCVPTTRRPSRLKFRATVAFRPTKSSPFSTILSPISTPRARAVEN